MSLPMSKHAPLMVSMVKGSKIAKASATRDSSRIVECGSAGLAQCFVFLTVVKPANTNTTPINYRAMQRHRNKANKSKPRRKTPLAVRPLAVGSGCGACMQECHAEPEISYHYILVNKQYKKIVQSLDRPNCNTFWHAEIGS